MKTRYALIRACIGALLLALPFGTQAQFVFTTNADGSLNISDYTNSAGNGTVIVPDTTNDVPITSIGVDAFFLGTTITNVIMGTNIASIGAGAFNGCFNLASVMMPDGITNIGASCFYYCYSLTNVAIPSGLTMIAYEAFESCTSLTSVTIPSGVTYIGQMAFDGCSCLTNTTIPFGVTNIDFGAFQASGLTTAAIPGSVAGIGADAFGGCQNLTSITIPDSVTSIGQNAFSGCSSLITVTIPDGVTSLVGNTFAQCKNLTSVTVGTGVTNITGSVFVLCTNLEAVYFKGNAPTIDLFSEEGAPAIAYYLPGTTGWGPMLGQIWHTKLWNPQAQTGNGSFGVGMNGFGFKITGSSNLVIVVQAATNLDNPIWLAVSTNTLDTFVGTNGTSYFSDPAWTKYPSRFYRFSSP